MTRYLTAGLTIKGRDVQLVRIKVKTLRDFEVALLASALTAAWYERRAHTCRR